MPVTAPAELIAAAATPVADHGGCHRPLYVAHLRDLLARGCDGVALFGTTGEGPGFTVAERCAVLDAVVEEIDARHLIMAAMSAAPGDIVALGRHALGAGVTRLLVMPPFFFRDAARPEGLLRFYGDLVDALADDRVRLLLYHFPKMSGAPITVELARGLRERLGPLISGMKDSGGSRDETLRFVRELPDLRVYTGTEVHVPAVLAAGGAGTICGLANAAPEVLRALVAGPEAAEAALLVERLETLDRLLTAAPFVVALKAALALATGAPAWAAVVPPLLPLDSIAAERLDAGLAEWRGARPGCR